MLPDAAARPCAAAWRLRPHRHPVPARLPSAAPGGWRAQWCGVPPAGGHDGPPEPRFARALPTLLPLDRSCDRPTPVSRAASPTVASAVAIRGTRRLPATSVGRPGVPVRRLSRRCRERHSGHRAPARQPAARRCRAVWPSTAFRRSVASPNARPGAVLPRAPAATAIPPPGPGAVWPAWPIRGLSKGLRKPVPLPPAGARPRPRNLRYTTCCVVRGQRGHKLWTK